jgi:hypothetical protein
MFKIAKCFVSMKQWCDKIDQKSYMVKISNTVNLVKTARHGQIDVNLFQIRKNIVVFHAQNPGFLLCSIHRKAR